ncbi:MAG: RluA family pseudouridine synthase [bacterium]
MIAPHVIYKDAHILVLDKPSGMEVRELGQWVRNNFKLSGSDEDFLKRGGLVHRLDKPTSGIILAALKYDAFINLQKQFKERQVKKEYLALVHGTMKENEGIIETPVKRSPFNPLRFSASSEGRVSQTSYQVLERFQIPKDTLTPSFRKSKDPFLTTVTLVRAMPKTGRTHQIRVHFKHLGHPLVGDTTYTGRKMLRNDARWCPRLFLHAGNLQIKHPQTGRILSFESPLSNTLETVLTLLYNENDQI